MLSLLSLIFLVPAALAISPIVQIRDPPVTLTIATRINTTGTARLVEADRARAQLFLKKAADAKAGRLSTSAAPIGVPVTNGADYFYSTHTPTQVTYTTNVGVGTPPTQYTLIVDTGSSNTWVGATTPFTATSTTRQTGQFVNVTYGSGSFSGTEVIDQVILPPNLVIASQSIGVASTSIGFQGVDGIIGIGPTDLTRGTLSPNIHALIPTVTDNLFSQGTIPSDQIGISFEPTTSPSVTNGEITFGGTDSTKFTGYISFTPITTTFPSSLFWGINQSIRLGTSTTILSTTAGIVDTGTTLVLIATNAFIAYQTAIGAVLDAATGLLRLTPTQFANIKSLFFTVGGTTFELTANAQAWPRSLNTLIGGNANSVYLIVADIGAPSGQGLDFINGFTFLERFYSVYDTANKQVGLATTPFTHATTN